MKNLIYSKIRTWWKWLLYEPHDPRHLAGCDIKIVVIGGGTGLSNLLRGLKIYSSHITAIVAVTDDGKSSGLIRKEFDILPPGDIRKCISALSYDEELISNILEYRFTGNSKVLEGHTLGNIWITALSKYFNSFAKAVEATTEIFKTAGKVLPVTLEKIDLIAKYADGKKKIGESKIARPGIKIKKIYLSKENVKANPKAVAAIKNAQLIIVGPGSLYTSILPNLLISGITDAIRKNTRSVNVFACNCSTERGETENYSVNDHLKTIIDHIGGNPFDCCLVNSKVIKTSKNSSLLGNVNNITTEENEIFKSKIIKADLVNPNFPLYHDSGKLAKEIITLYNKVKK